MGRIWVSPVEETDQRSPPSVDTHAVPFESTMSSSPSGRPRISPPFPPTAIAQLSGMALGRHHVMPPSELTRMSRPLPAETATKRPLVP
jgi:hypothetical protein